MGPGPVVASGVKVGDNVSFFANASTMSWISIGEGSTISCGAGVKTSIPPNTTF